MLDVQFNIVRTPLNSDPSILPIRHPTLDGKELEIIWVLQTGVDVKSKTHGSHYQALFPLYSIDGQSVTEIDFSKLQVIRCDKALMIKP